MALLPKSSACRTSGKGGGASSLDVYRDVIGDEDCLKLTFTLRGEQRRETITVSIHPDDFLQVAHQMRGVNEDAFLEAFAKAKTIVSRPIQKHHFLKIESEGNSRGP